MPYLGNIPAEAYSTFDKQTITGDGGTSYTLDQPVGSAQEVAIFVNNVRQEPGVAYTVSGTALTMTGDVESSDDFYAIFIGKAVQTVKIPEQNDDGSYTFSDDVTVTGTTTFSDDVDVNGNELILDADGDTSITADTDDQIDFKTGGTDRLIIDSVGNVGIGTSPATNYTMHTHNAGATFVYNKFTNSTTGNGGGANGLDVGISGVNALIYNYESGRIQFATGGTERMRLTSSGMQMASGHQIDLNGGRIFTAALSFSSGTSTIDTLAMGEAAIYVAQFRNYGGSDFRHGSVFYAQRTANGTPSTTTRSTTLSSQSSSSFSMSGANVQYYAGGGIPATTIYKLRLI